MPISVTLKRWLVFFICVCAAMVVGVFLVVRSFLSGPEIDPTRVKSLSFVLFQGERAPYEAQAQDMVACREIIAVLNAGSWADRHACPVIEWIYIHQADAKESIVYLVQGHEPEDYEIRFGSGWYQISRGSLFAALQAAGIDTNRFATASP